MVILDHHQWGDSRRKRGAVASWRFWRNLWAWWKKACPSSVLQRAGAFWNKAVFPKEERAGAPHLMSLDHQPLESRSSICFPKDGDTSSFGVLRSAFGKKAFHGNRRSPSSLRLEECWCSAPYASWSSFTVIEYHHQESGAVLSERRPGFAGLLRSAS